MRPLVVSRRGKVRGGFRPRSEPASCGNRPEHPANRFCRTDCFTPVERKFAVNPSPGTDQAVAVADMSRSDARRFGRCQLDVARYVCYGARW